VASFALDLNALKYLLLDVGIPADVVSEQDARRNAYHCLANIYTMTDGHPKSQVFGFLKGKDTWLTPYIDPPMPIKVNSIVAREVMDRLEESVLNTAKWLQRAKVPVNVRDAGGNTPLHVAAIGGIYGLVKHLLDNGADASIANNELRTPLHYAATMGHAQVCGLLIQAGSDMHAVDRHGISPADIMTNPGPILPSDLLQYVNMTQRPPKKIGRIIHPEIHPDIPKTGWVGGTGGWGEERLPGYEDDMECEFDEFWADEIDGEMLFKEYIGRGIPVLIRGLLEEWPALQMWTRANLTEDFGDLRVEVRRGNLPDLSVTSFFHIGVVCECVQLY
jgi:Ankyrin repeats (3 copies)